MNLAEIEKELEEIVKALREWGLTIEYREEEIGWDEIKEKVMEILRRGRKNE